MYMVQHVAFGYWEDCETWDLFSVTRGVLKSHLADAQFSKCSYIVVTGDIVIAEARNLNFDMRVQH